MYVSFWADESIYAKKVTYSKFEDGNVSITINYSEMESPNKVKVSFVLKNISNSTIYIPQLTDDGLSEKVVIDTEESAYHYKGSRSAMYYVYPNFTRPFYEVKSNDSISFELYFSFSEKKYSWLKERSYPFIFEYLPYNPRIAEIVTINNANYNKELETIILSDLEYSFLYAYISMECVRVKLCLNFE